MSSDITIYYENTGIDKNTVIELTRDNRKFTYQKPRNTSNLMYKGNAYYLDFILYNQDKNKIYIIHANPSGDKRFILVINITEKSTFATEDTLDEYLVSYDNVSSPKNTINVKSLIDKSILNPSHKKVEIGVIKDNAKEIQTYVCEIGMICVKRETNEQISPRMTSVDRDDPTKYIPVALTLENKEVRVVISSTPKKTIRNCARKNPYGPDKEPQLEKDYFLKYRSKNNVAVVATYMTITFCLIAFVFGFHLWTKDPFSDLWGTPIPQTIGFMGGSGIPGSGIQGSSMSGGGSCYIPDEITVQFPKPDLIAFGKMAAFLFFIQTIIYGAMKNNNDWIGVSVTVLVLLAVISGGLRLMQKVGIDDGINFSNMFLFSDEYPPAKIPALLMYLTFYTSFIRLASKQYKKDEIIAFVLNFLLFAFWGVGLVVAGVKSMFNPLFWIPAIIMMGLSVWYMVIIFEPPKDEDKASNAGSTPPSSSSSLTSTNMPGIGGTGTGSVGLPN